MRFSAVSSSEFSGASALAQLLPSADSSESGMIENALHRGVEFKSVLAELPSYRRAEFERRFEANGLQELNDLSRETDPEMFFEALLAFGIRQEQAGHTESAARVYAVLVQNRESSQNPLTPGIFQTVQVSVRERAQIRLNALLGQGEVGPRAEFLLRRLAQESCDPSALVAMGAAGALFKLTRLATLSRLIASPTANVLTRGLGANAVAALAGFAVEGAAFPIFGHLANEAMGRPTPWNLLDREMGSSYLILGGMRLAGWSAYRVVSSQRGLLQPVFRQSAMLGGILFGRRLEETFQLRERRDGATWLLDSLATLLQFHVAGNLTQGLFGKNFLAWERGMDWRNQSLAASTLHRSPWNAGSAFLPEFAMATAYNEAKKLEPLRNEAGDPFSAGTTSYRKFQYPPGGSGARPASLRYPPAARRLWSDLEPVLQGIPWESSAQEIIRNRADIETADQMWLFQIQDFARLVGARLEVHPPERLVELFTRQYMKPESQLLQAAAASVAGKGRVYELSLPYADAIFGRPNERGNYAGLSNVLADVEGSFGNKIMLSHVKDGRLTFRMPNFALWEALLNERFGTQAHRLVFVDGSIPRQRVMGLRGKLLTPVGLTRQPIFINEMNGRAHPFFYTFHDLFHATLVSMLPPELCRTSAWLYALADRGLPQSWLKQGHLNRLADMDPGSEFSGNPEILFKFVLQDFWDSFRQDVMTDRMTPRRILYYPQFLKSYQRLLQQNPVPFEDTRWRDDFRRRLEETSREFSRVLVMVLRN